MPLPGRYGPPPVPPPEPGPTPAPSPDPRPVPVPVPAPPPVPDPWLSFSAGAFSRTPTRLRVSAGAVTIGAMSAGSGSDFSGSGFGSGGAGTGVANFGSRRMGTGLLSVWRPSRSAFGAGAFSRRPPPPPPPPGPGVATNTSRIGSAGRSSGNSAAARDDRLNLARNAAKAIRPAWRVLDNASGTPAER